MNAQDIIAITVAVISLALVIRSLYRQMTTGGCGSSCHCSHASSSEAAMSDQAEPRSLKRTPLITLGQAQNSHQKS
jgi:hypothetical protein